MPISSALLQCPRSAIVQLCLFKAAFVAAFALERVHIGQITSRAAKEGLASLMRPQRPLSMNRSHPALPLRCDPNGYPSDRCGTKPRWCHEILRALFTVIYRGFIVFPRTSLIARPAYLTSDRLAKCQVTRADPRAGPSGEYRFRSDMRWGSIGKTRQR